MFVVDTHVDLDAPQFTSKLRAPYGILATLLGPPSRDRPEKCSTFWALRSEADDEAGACIKDRIADTERFDVKAFRAEPVYDWDVLATTQGVGMTFCRWLSGLVIAKISEVKTLSPEAKQLLNKLIAEGVPMGEAMKQVTLEKPADLAKKYAWPIKAR
jgi:hypothetical protein